MLRDALQAQVREAGLDEHVAFLGFVPENELVGYYQAADAFVLPTRELEGFGLQDDYALLYDGGKRFVGLPEQAVLQRTRNASFLLNVMGFLRDERVLGQARRRVFLDTDPGYGQMWQDLGLARMFSDHDDYVTIAENIGSVDCAIPTCDIDWVTWRQPVVLGSWPAAAPNPVGAFVSVGAWRGPYAPIERPLSSSYFV